MRKWLLMAVLLVSTVTAYAQEQTPEPGLFTFEFEGEERGYSLFVPDEISEPAPLVMVLHGRLGDGEMAREYTDFDTTAEREGFIAVYPDAIDGEWNYTRGIRGYDAPQDDIGFLIALVDHLAETYPVDLSRVYIAGFSNGGFMAQRVACENPSRFAAFASVAAGGFGGMLDVCAERGTLTAPMLLMHGTDDPNILWDGVSVTRGEQTVYITYPIPETLAYWAEFNGCQPQSETLELPQLGLSQGTVVRRITVECPPDASVILYSVIGGGHHWPRFGQTGSEEAFGLINRDIEAAQEIWDFFKQHTRQGP